MALSAAFVDDGNSDLEVDLDEETVTDRDDTDHEPTAGDTQVPTHEVGLHLVWLDRLTK